MPTPKDRRQNYLISLLCLLIPVLAFAFYYLDVPTYHYSDAPGIARQVEDDPDSTFLYSKMDLPYWQYRHLADSVHAEQNRYTTHYGFSVSGYPFGVGHFRECYDCFSGWDNDWERGDDKYFLLLSGLRRNTSMFEDLFYKSVFFHKQGKYFVKYVRYDTTYLPGTHTISFIKGAWVTKPIRYQADEVRGSGDREMRLLIPVSKPVYIAWKVALFVIMGIAFILCWLCFRKFVQVLVEIAQGNAFSVSNYSRLFFIANSIGICSIVAWLLQHALQWWYHGLYSQELAIIANWGLLIKGLLLAAVFYVIARAFRKGYDIQNEQELTI